MKGRYTYHGSYHDKSQWTALHSMDFKSRDPHLNHHPFKFKLVPAFEQERSGTLSESLHLEQLP